MKCQESDACNWFVFDPREKKTKCWIMAGKKSPYPATGKDKDKAASGPKVCPGECSMVEKPFCGDDENEYKNKCLADKKGIKGTEGPCKSKCQITLC